MTSLLGIGGGELMGPLLVHMKLLPQVFSCYSTCYCISSLPAYVVSRCPLLQHRCWVSSQPPHHFSTTQLTHLCLWYMAPGYLLWDSLVWSGLLYLQLGSYRILGGISGRQAGNYIINHFGRPSITVFALCVVLAIAIGLLVYDVVSAETEFTAEPLC